MDILPDTQRSKLDEAQPQAAPAQQARLSASHSVSLGVLWVSIDQRSRLYQVQPQSAAAPAQQAMPSSAAHRHLT